MKKSNFLRSTIVALLFVTLLAPGVMAKSTVADANDATTVAFEDLPVYMQLLIYVSHLLTVGEEVPKALLNKIDAWYKTGQ